MKKMNTRQKPVLSKKDISILVAVIVTFVAIFLFAAWNSFFTHKALAEKALAYKVKMNSKCEHYKKKAPEPQRIFLHEDHYSCDFYLNTDILPVGSTIAEARLKAKAAGLTIPEGN